jgi:hypothetical protein
MRLDIEQIMPGMKLAEPITNASGVTLMPAGIRLTPMFIARIRKWGIAALDVLVEKRPPDTAARRAALARKNAELAQKQKADGADGVDALTAEQEEFVRATVTEISRPFINVKNSPLMMQLRASAVRGLIAHGKSGVVNILRHPPVESALAEETASDGT